jgi:hypothetical protein
VGGGAINSATLQQPETGCVRDYKGGNGTKEKRRIRGREGTAERNSREKAVQRGEVSRCEVGKEWGEVRRGEVGGGGEM